MRVPIRPIKDRWPTTVQRQFSRFFWADPSVVVDPDVTSDDFRGAMSAVHVGGTIKITQPNRHPVADSLLLENVDLADATILDIGASDGTTSVDLISKLASFKSFVIADLFFTITAARVGDRWLFYDHADQCILVTGKRFVAWPGLSPAVARLYQAVIRQGRRPGIVREEVLLLNPTARRLIETDPRVSYAVHDIFEPWTGVAPDVIKVANLLRRLYFSDDKIRRALLALLVSLPEGGHLLIVDNPRAKVRPRGGLYRRVGGSFTVVALTDEPPEILDLVQDVRLP